MTSESNSLVQESISTSRCQSRWFRVRFSESIRFASSESRFQPVNPDSLIQKTQSPLANPSHWLKKSQFLSVSQNPWFESQFQLVSQVTGTSLLPVSPDSWLRNQVSASQSESLIEIISQPVRFIGSSIRFSLRQSESLVKNQFLIQSVWFVGFRDQSVQISWFQTSVSASQSNSLVKKSFLQVNRDSLVAL